MSERIDRIYDRYVAAEDLKQGTKYERLAAMVFQILDRSSTVIHDVILRANENGTAHQIDVSATTGSGERARVIVEARDRRTPVGLGQVRDFFGVAHQLQPDHAWIVSTSGFTKAAKQFAEEEGIGLAVLRPAERHEDNRLKAIRFSMQMRAMGIPRITRWVAADDAERARVAPLIAASEGSEQLIDTTTRMFFDEAGVPVGTMEEILDPVFSMLDLELGVNEGTYEFTRVLYVDLAGVRTAVRGFDYRVELSQSTHDFTVGNPSSLAALIVQSIAGTVSESVDRVIYDTELHDLALGEDGRVVRRSLGSPRPQ